MFFFFTSAPVSLKLRGHFGRGAAATFCDIATRSPLITNSSPGNNLNYTMSSMYR